MTDPEHISLPIKRLWCKWFGHDWLPHSTFDWVCARCGAWGMSVGRTHA